MNVAFIGLGAMGAPMALNLAQAGATLAVYNRSSGKTAALAAAGATVAPTPAAAAADADVVCTCVANPQALRDVLLGDEGAIGGAKPGALFIDFSTVDPATVREMAAACAERGGAFMEAPVSGGVKGAREGSLTIMVGGEEADFERAQPVLEVVGETISHVGPVGSASAIKLINQMLVGVHLAAALQAFVLAQRAGLDLDVLHGVLTASTGDSAMLRRGARNLFQDDFEPGFKVDLLLKDLRLARGLGQEADVPLTLAATTQELFEAASQRGLGERDIASAVLTMPWDRMDTKSQKGP